ncbi:MAG TPA: hypothetical protein PKN75_05295 [Bacteroidia bacterium]|nr:hypothetical protein [Bacteroidia bacterium]HNU32988.1 hypothetical protein [Bacteroidia bacterium]
MTLNKKLWVITIFSIAMGLLETAVVVYLREIYYPNGFSFPLVPIENKIAITELLREAATIIMLITLGMITGKNTVEKFAWFIFSFAIWDIFYYIFLKVLLNWPATILDWDILFLIPVPWVGPVLAPCIISVLMILLAITLLRKSAENRMQSLNKTEWMLLITGSLILIFSFTIDYFLYANSIDARDKNQLLAELSKFIPQSYNWFIFAIGIIPILYATFKVYKR